MRWEKREKPEWQWKPWFAWYPVLAKCANDHRMWVWLEKIWRQGRRAKIAPYTFRWIWDWTASKPGKEKL